MHIQKANFHHLYLKIPLGGEGRRVKTHINRTKAHFGLNYVTCINYAILKT